jgi:hypothetical protein
VKSSPTSAIHTFVNLSVAQNLVIFVFYYVLLSSYPAVRRLRATECISPVIDRSKLLLFPPFRKVRTWKLSATSYLCYLGTLGELLERSTPPVLYATYPPPPPAT